MASSSSQAPSGEGSGTTRGSSQSSKLDNLLLEKLKSRNDHSRENSPDTSKDVVHRSGSSRRKPAVIRKVVESDDEGSQSFMADIDETNSSNDFDKASLGEMANGENTTANGTTEESIDIDEQGNYILPEGTVVVEPEDVDDEDTEEFRGPEFKGGRRKTANGDLDIICCSACNKQINHNASGAVRRHPVLKVLICKKCYNWYTSDEIDQDSDGSDEQCRWCGEGGDLICCDYCHNAFCKSCIKRNLGRKELNVLLNQDEDVKWHCYVCDPKPLRGLVDECSRIIKTVEDAKKPRPEAPKRKSTAPPVNEYKPGSKGKYTANTKPKGSQQHSQPPGTRQDNNQGSFFNENSEFAIHPMNVPPVLDKLIAASQSMNTLFASLKDEVKVSGSKQIQQIDYRILHKVAKKLKHAMCVYKQSLNDIEKFARTFHPPIPVEAAYKHGPGGGGRIVRTVDGKQVPQNMFYINKDGAKVPLFQFKEGQISVHPLAGDKNAGRKPVQDAEVIELSDSSEDDVPAKSKSSPKRSEPTVSSGKKQVSQEGKETSKEATKSKDHSQSQQRESDTDGSVRKKKKVPTATLR